MNHVGFNIFFNILSDYKSIHLIWSSINEFTFKCDILSINY